MMRNVSKLLKMDLRSRELFLNLPPLYWTSEYHWAMWRLIQKPKYIWCVYLFWNNALALLFYSAQLLIYYPTCTWILLYKQVNASSRIPTILNKLSKSPSWNFLWSGKTSLFLKVWKFLNLTWKSLKLRTPSVLMGPGWLWPRKRPLQLVLLIQEDR